MRQLTFGARWDFGPVSLRYDALIGDRNKAGSTTETELGFQQHTAAVGVSPACDCWRLDVFATQPLFPTVVFPQVGFNVTISKFGTIGSR